jgi:VanZ family protein
MTKRIIYGILMVIWMVVIFSFSNSTGVKSDSLSKKVISNAITLYENVTNKDVDNEYYLEKLDFPVRKLAHFTEYAILGFLVINFCLSFNMLYAGTFSILLCFLYAMSDEFHQLFINGRSGQFTDVLIDTSGAIIMIGIIKLFKRKKNNTK